MKKLVVESLHHFLKVNEDIKHLSPKTPEEIADIEKRGFRMQRGKWKFTIDIEEIWSKVEEDEDYYDFIQKLIPILQSKVEDLSTFLDEYEVTQFERIIDEFETISGDPDLEVDNVDYVLNMMYDWADENNIWIKTII